MRLTLVTAAPTAAARRMEFPLPGEPATGLPAPGPVPDAAWTAPELRALGTAAALGLDAEPEPLLADLDVGSWTGHSLADLGQREPGVHAWLSDPAAAPHGGEPVTELLLRAGAWLDGLATQHRDVPAAFRVHAVTHPAVVRALLLHVLEAPPAAFWRVEAPALTATELTRRAGRWTVLRTSAPWPPAGSGDGPAAAAGS